MTRTKGAKDKVKRDTEYLKSNLEKARAKSPIYQEEIKKNVDDENYNSKLIRFMGEVVAETRPGPHDIELMKARFQNYLQKCDEYGMKVGNKGAYMAIGISQADVEKWLNGGNASIEVVNFIKKVKEICGFYREGLMQEGKINPVTGIFWQKNYDGLKDQQETVVTTNQNFNEIQDSEKLRKKYLDASYTETDMSLNYTQKEESFGPESETENL